MSLPRNDDDEIRIHRQVLEADAGLSLKVWAYSALWRGQPVGVQAVVFRPDNTALFLTPQFNQNADDQACPRSQIIARLARVTDEEVTPLGLAYLQSVVEGVDPDADQSLTLSGFQSITEVDEFVFTFTGDPIRTAALKPLAEINLSAPAHDDPRWFEAFALSEESSLDIPEVLALRPLTETFASFRQLLDSDGDAWRIVLVEGELAGLVLPSLAGSGNWELKYLGVKASLRRRGVGRALLGYALQTAHSAGAATLTAGVDVRNVAATELYRSVGFQHTSSRKLWIRPGAKS